MKRIFVLFLLCVLPLAACTSNEDNSTSVRPPGDSNLSAVSPEVAFPNLSFNLPLYVTQVTDGTGRFFVVEQSGIILTFDSARATSTVDTFLDIRDRVTKSAMEEGLLGLAFHPDFHTNGYFYVNYTAANPLRTVIARYTVSPSSSNHVDKNTEQVILTFEQPYPNHNGGCLQFGPDGYLYIGVGDGGSAGDPQNNGQSTKTLLGKILRIDVNSSSGSRQYSIPPDNPFAGSTDGSREEIYAYGLRNPWRFSFDKETGHLWVADVGQDKIEEVDIVEKGKNYGWSKMEGRSCFKPATGCDTTGLVQPIFQYTHAQGISITGGYVYRGTQTPALQGTYVCADFGSGRMWAIKYDGNAATVTELPKTELSISSFGVDANGELYLTSFDGRVYKLVQGK